MNELNKSFNKWLKEKKITIVKRRKNAVRKCYFSSNGICVKKNDEENYYFDYERNQNIINLVELINKFNPFASGKNILFFLYFLTNKKNYFFDSGNILFINNYFIDLRNFKILNYKKGMFLFVKNKLNNLFKSNMKLNKKDIIFFTSKLSEVPFEKTIENFFNIYASVDKKRYQILITKENEVYKIESNSFTKCEFDQEYIDDLKNCFTHFFEFNKQRIVMHCSEELYIKNMITKKTNVIKCDYCINYEIIADTVIKINTWGDNNIIRKL